MPRCVWSRKPQEWVGHDPRWVAAPQWEKKLSVQICRCYRVRSSPKNDGEKFLILTSNVSETGVDFLSAPWRKPAYASYSCNWVWWAVGRCSRKFLVVVPFSGTRHNVYMTILNGLSYKVWIWSHMTWHWNVSFSLFSSKLLYISYISSHLWFVQHD